MQLLFWKIGPKTAVRAKIALDNSSGNCMMYCFEPGKNMKLAHIFRNKRKTKRGRKTPFIAPLKVDGITPLKDGGYFIHSGKQWHFALSKAMTGGKTPEIGEEIVTYNVRQPLPPSPMPRKQTTKVLIVAIKFGGAIYIVGNETELDNPTLAALNRDLRKMEDEAMQMPHTHSRNIGRVGRAVLESAAQR